MNRIWFTSDQHFDHRNVIKYCARPFHHPRFFGRLREWYTKEVSAEAVHLMNETLIANFNEVVGPNDLVYHLGDFSLNKAAPEKYLHRLNGAKHILIMGNHDAVHPTFKCSPSQKIKYFHMYEQAGFAEIHETLEMNLLGTRVQLHHMPFANPTKEHYDQRYLEYRPKNEGQILLHGHVHEAWHKKGNMFNVGVDVNGFKPVSLEEVLEFVGERMGADEEFT